MENTAMKKFSNKFMTWREKHGIIGRKYLRHLKVGDKFFYMHMLNPYEVIYKDKQFIRFRSLKGKVMEYPNTIDNKMRVDIITEEHYLPFLAKATAELMES